MKEENNKSPQDEMLEEEYRLGKEYYKELIEKAKEETKEKYK